MKFHMRRAHERAWRLLPNRQQRLSQLVAPRHEGADMRSEAQSLLRELKPESDFVEAKVPAENDVEAGNCGSTCGNSALQTPALISDRESGEEFLGIPTFAMCSFNGRFMGSAFIGEIADCGLALPERESAL